MQARTRVFVNPTDIPFANGHVLRLTQPQTHYIGTVLRLKVDDLISVFNAEDGAWTARITVMRKGVCDLTLEDIVRPGSRQGGAPVSGPTLAFALLKRDATDMVIRMGTELGVRRFAPVITERANTHRINAHRLSAIAREAAEQCERLDIPEIAEPVALPLFLSKWPASQPLYVGLERSGSVFPVSVPVTWGYLVGPEGGFSEAEVSLLTKSDFTHAFSMGANILRADTAAAAGLSALTIASNKA